MPNKLEKTKETRLFNLKENDTLSAYNKIINDKKHNNNLIFISSFFSYIFIVTLIFNLYSLILIRIYKLKNN